MFYCLNDVKFKDIIIRKAFRLEEESLGCLVERDGYIAIAAQVKVSLNQSSPTTISLGEFIFIKKVTQMDYPDNGL